ncbi:MAG: transcriptional regulator [Rhizobiales bacterium 65-9]|nr:winged helix-turn-helix transcriptional regulator [Hyphomicrobiales bacterium]OJY38366.1 MAG: transcriptional regulator [Rhizobiales bacterium 65-9]
MENQQLALDRAFAALSDPTRRAVVARLCLGEATVSQLAEPFGIGLPTVLKHIRVLEDGGLLATRKAGRVRLCALRPEALRQTDAWLGEHLRIWTARLDRMDAHVQRRKNEVRTDD